MQDNCNYDMYSNPPFVINIGSHKANGLPVSYSEVCSSIVCFPHIFPLNFYFLRNENFF